MCGIAGIWGRDAAGDRNPAWRDDVARMLAAMRHRGPDASRIADSATGVLGACRLAVFDPAGGAQPMSTADGRVVVALNGAVVNHPELRATLAADGAAFRSHCDTEVVLEGLARRGKAFLGEMNGMFAVAAFDTADGSALLARDPCGIKPLHWIDEGDRVLFASEIKSLLAAVRRRPAPCREAVLDWLAFQAPLTDATWFEGVRRVPPGSVLRLRRGDAPAIEPLPGWRDVPDVPEEPAAAAEALRALLHDAVRIHVRSDVPVGAHLSGGFDSSFVVARAARELAGRLHVFTGAFDLRGFDERPSARAVAVACGVPQDEVVIGPGDFLDALPLAAAAMDEPAAGPGLVPQWCVARRTATRVKVVLGGQGGDELFGGYARTLALRLGAAVRAAAAAGDTSALRRIAPHLGALDGYEPLVRRVLDIAPGASDAARVFHILHRGAGLGPVLGPALRDAHASHPAFERFAGEWGPAACADPVERELRFERRVLLPALLQVEDRTASAWSLESRVPLLDRRVLAFVDRCPPGVLLGDGEPKFLFRRAVLRDLPAAARDRTDKMGFPVPLAQWARGPLESRLREFLAGGAAAAHGWIDPAAVPGLLGAEPVEARHLWAALNMELWLRTHAT